MVKPKTKALTAISPMQRKILTTHEWRVYSDDKITQNGIAERLSDTTDRENSTGNIFYNGEKIPVFIVDWMTVEFLANNRHSVPYKFIAYHRKNDKESWARWLEGKKSPAEINNRNKKKGAFKRSSI